MFDKHFSKILAFLIFLTFDLMLLGAAVRAMNAGLACPDWPLCFGQVLPKYNLQVYLEVIHRFIAGVVALIFFFLYITALLKPKFRGIRLVFNVALFLLLAQIIMGGLTVLKILQPGIVTMHLGLATAFLIALMTAQLKISDYFYKILEHRLFFIFTNIGVCLVFAQILLGGWVASNYAGLACVDFPTCNGQWFPMWTGPIGAQVIHRLGAYTVASFFIFYFLFSLRLASQQRISAAQKRVAGECFLIIFSQIAVGVMNLRLLVPAWLTVIHLGLALYLLVTILKLSLMQNLKKTRN
jgi:heme a synthase